MDNSNFIVVMKQLLVLVCDRLYAVKTVITFTSHAEELIKEFTVFSTTISYCG